MKKILSFCCGILFFFFFVNVVSAYTTTSCEYLYSDRLQGIKYHLTCEITYNPSALIYKEKFTCNFDFTKPNLSKNLKVKKYKKPDGASYDIFEHLKNGETACPTYAIVNSANNGYSFESWYLTDNEADANLAVESGTANSMIIIQHESGLDCTNFDEQIQKWEEEIQEFKEHSCDVFDVHPQAVISKHRECMGYLPSRNLFSQVLEELQIEYTSGCMDTNTYNRYRDQITSYQTQYNQLIEELDQKRNEGGNPNYEPETAENCSDYTSHSECYYGSMDSQGHACYWDAGENYCRVKTKCSDFTTQTTCPERSDTSRCYWNSSTNTCDKKDFFTCPDYNAKENCPSTDEQGNRCVWDDHEGCSYVSSSVGGSTHEPVEENEFTWSSISTGQICRSNNLKVPLKYIGWVLSILKILIPILIIAFGVMDFLKAIASQKPDELSKAIKTVIVRVLSGVIIFLVPTIINFVFVLIDDWSQYSTAYSDCTKCLFDPKNC